MSAATATGARKRTPKAVSVSNPGFARIPYYFIEHLAAFTPAERAFVLVLFRRGSSKANPFLDRQGNLIEGVTHTISDQTWIDWTGLSPRQKQYAIDGLIEKGLEVSGRGDDRRYSFSPEKVRSYVSGWRDTAAGEKPRTKGRSIAVTAEPGMKVHPDCSATGCQRLCETACDDKPKLLQVVSNSPANPSCFPLSAAFVSDLFPVADPEFCNRLVKNLPKSIKRVTDAELLAALQFAWAHKKKSQQSEGLFMHTVPAALAHNRKIAAPVDEVGTHRAERPERDSFSDRAIKFLNHEAAKVEASGVTDAKAIAADVRALAEDVRYDRVPVDQMQEKLDALDRRIYDGWRSTAGAKAIATLADEVRAAVGEHGKLMSDSQKKAMRDSVMIHRALKLLDLKRLGSLPWV